MRKMNIGKGIPGETMAMDVGVLPWTDDPVKGYRYFLLMVYLFTRYVEVQPLRLRSRHSPRCVSAGVCIQGTRDANNNTNR